MFITNKFDFQLAVCSYQLADGTTLGQQLDHIDFERKKLIFKESSVLKYISFTSYGYTGKAYTKAHIKPKVKGHLDYHERDIFSDEAVTLFVRRALAKADKEYLSNPTPEYPLKEVWYGR